MSESQELVTLTIDGQQVSVPKGTNVIEAAKKLGLEVSAFCYHPGLEIVAVCRQCLVTIEGQPKLTPSCQAIATEGMVVHTTDQTSKLARKQMLEFTLVNHPIDCPICDKAGECSLQRYYFDHDNADSRVDVAKVEKPKAVDLGPHIVLDAERCILCTRCIRVCDEVAGQHQLEMKNRNDHQELCTAPGERLDNPYSINTVDVCPVGALTNKDFRFTMRAWELYSTPSVCNGCATGCNVEIHHKQERVWRLVPRFNEAVNKHWMCDDGRFTYHALREHRAASPVVDGMPAPWERAVDQAARRLKAALADGRERVGVVLSPRFSNEDNYVFAKLARQHLQLTRIYVGGAAPVPQRADKILRDADVNANTRGVRAILGGGAPQGPAVLEQDLEAGELSALIMLGGDELALSPTAQQRVRDLDVVVAIAAHEYGAAKHAHVLLPAAAWAEVNATVTNRDGRVQRMRPAFAPAGKAIPAWQAAVLLGRALDATLAYDSPRQIFEEMIGQVEDFRGATWGREVRPIQLRFAHSRG